MAVSPTDYSAVNTAVVVLALACATVALVSCLKCKKWKLRKKKGTKKDIEAANGTDLKSNKNGKDLNNGSTNHAFHIDPKPDVSGDVIDKEENENDEGCCENDKETTFAGDVSENHVRKASVDAAGKGDGAVDDSSSALAVSDQHIIDSDNETATAQLPVTFDDRNSSSSSQTSPSPSIASAKDETPSPPSSSADDRPPERDWSKYNHVTLENGWRRPINLADVVRMDLIGEGDADAIAARRTSEVDDDGGVPEALKPFAIGRDPVAGVIVSATGEKKSIYRSAKDGTLRRGTAIGLLEAQAATGNIIDPVGGRKMSVADACQLGLIDRIYESVVARAERAATGYATRDGRLLSVGEAAHRGLVMEARALRLLDAQLATGGAIDPRTNLHLPLGVAVEQGVVDATLAAKLAGADAARTYYDHNAEEHVTYAELMRRSVREEETGMLLYPLRDAAPRRRPGARNGAGYMSGVASLASSRYGSFENLAAVVPGSRPLTPPPRIFL